jgi:two-component system, OmpR family, sensor kinase
MRTPSLRRRVIVSATAVFTCLLIAFDAFLYLTLRDSLEAALSQVLRSRVELAQELGATYEADELADHLVALGVPVVVTTPEGRVVEGEPALPRFQVGPPGPATGVLQPRGSQLVELPDGGTVEVFATRAGVDRTLERTALLLAVGSALAILAAFVLLRRTTAAAIAPLDHVVDKADRTASGHPGERLEPDDPHSELGRMAVAYDDMLDALESALNQAYRAEERTRRFVDDAAHQLRTPIAAVRASVESLLAVTSPEEQDRLMANLVRETGRTSRLLQDLLMLARLDDAEPPHRVHVDLVAIVRDEADRASSLSPHLRLPVASTPDAPPVLVEERLVRDAVANLLDNARRHARSRVEVSVSSQGSDAEVVVRDDGEGLPPGSEELVFERFVSLSGQGGAGLGLPIARSVARAHGGDLRYEDGAFVLTIATAGDHAPAPPSSTSAT